MSKIKNIENLFFIYDVENHLQIKDAILNGIDDEPLKPKNSENERIFNANYSRRTQNTILKALSEKISKKYVRASRVGWSRFYVVWIIS